MKFAIVNNERQEARQNLVGRCVGCESLMLARCGEVRVHHWAHQGRKICDPWWENETEWHRSWKNKFPTTWQEIVHHSVDGEKHIADVKTKDGWIIEFQHSYIKPVERRSREKFYEKLIWVVDGNRRIKDKKRFFEILGDRADNKNYPNLRSTFPEGALFRDWIESNTHVFFDFGDDDLWWLLPQSNDYWAYVLPVTRMDFLEFHSEKYLSNSKRFEFLIGQYDIKVSEPTKLEPELNGVVDIHPNAVLMKMMQSRRFHL